MRQVIDHGTYQTRLHRLVFDGLVSDRAEGFVQIDWVPQEVIGVLEAGPPLG